jgi:signal transduction histidine kinase/CheY-like chemotaxis protein
MQSLDLEKSPILKGILSSLDQGIAIFSADRKLLYMNPAMKSVAGGSDKSIGGALEDLSRRHRLRMKDGEPIDPRDFPIERAFAGEETRDEPFLYIAPNGRTVWLSISCLRVTAEDGALQHVVIAVSNISDRKIREDRLRFMVESGKILSLTADFHKRLTQKARLAVPLLADWCAIDLVSGKSTERVVTIHQKQDMLDFLKEYYQKYPPDPSSPNSIYNAIKQQSPRFFPVVTDDLLRSFAQSPEHFADLKRLQLKSVLIVPIVSRGKGLGALTLAYAESGRTYTEDDLQFFKEFCAHLGVVIDNARLYEAIKKRDGAKDLFLASLSHELRNPLAPIKSSLEILKMKDAPPELREEFDVIEHQFDHMARLLNDLLEVTRFTHSKISLSLTPVDLRVVVDRALKSSGTFLENADVTLHRSFADEPIYVHADETRIEQAVTNLMSNAAKFTPAGGSIWVDVEQEQGRACIRIKDNGAGIHADDLPNIFNMYYQGASTRDQASTGLGIGLLLVHRIISLHQGAIEARSEGPGKGSEFVISLPTLEGAAFTYGQAVQPAAAAAGKRILIVDDNIQAADSLAKLLSKVGARAKTLYSGEETLSHELAPYDVIFLDVGMPRIDGYQIAEALRRRGITTPLVALTGYGMADDKKRAHGAGFSAHLTKPIGLKELSETIAALT